MPTHGMLDLETLDVLPGAVVLTIGGVKFNPFTDAEPHSEFYYRLEIEDQMERGRTTDDGTMSWWSQQTPEIIEEAFGDGDRHSVDTMLADLKKWCVGLDTIWAQGIAFDITMLEDMHRMYQKPLPWKFWQIEDSRTMMKRMPTDPRKQFSFAAHNALEDAKMQARCLQITMKHFNMTK